MLLRIALPAFGAAPPIVIPLAATSSTPLPALPLMVLPCTSVPAELPLT